MNMLAVLWTYLATFGAWCEAHPVFATVVIWPLLSAVVTTILKPRTSLEYALLATRQPVWVWSRIAAFLQLVAALGLDPVKAIKVLRKLVVGDVDPMPPKGPGLLPLVLVAGLLGFGASACKDTIAPRETARATVLVVADAVKQVDLACAELAKAKHDVTLATRCAEAYEPARAALIGADDFIDAWDSGVVGDLPCAVSKAVSGLEKLCDLIRIAGGKAPTAVDDAMKLAAPIAAACHG